MTNLEWVALAAATPEEATEFIYRYIVVSHSHIIGTNGKRIHVAPHYGTLTPGFYNPDDGAWISEYTGTPKHLQWTRNLPLPQHMEQQHQISHSTFDDYYCIGSELFPKYQVDDAMKQGNQAVYLTPRCAMFVGDYGRLALIAKVLHSED